MKEYMIIKTKIRTGSEQVFTGTLKDLIPMFEHTLEVGRCYQHERGNKKINTNPKTIKSLISNLNNAVNNSAANGYAGIEYNYHDM